MIPEGDVGQTLALCRRSAAWTAQARDQIRQGNAPGAREAIAKAIGHLQRADARLVGPADPPTGARDLGNHD